MNCAKRVVTVLFLFGMTFTSFIPIVSADEPASVPTPAPIVIGAPAPAPADQSSADAPADTFDCSADYNATKPIDNFQLQTVGVLAPDENQTEVPSPVSVYLNDDGMTVQLYYEGHPDHATDSTIIDVTLYASQAADVSSVPSSCAAFAAEYIQTSSSLSITSFEEDPDDYYYQSTDTRAEDNAVWEDDGWIVCCDSDCGTDCGKCTQKFDNGYGASVSMTGGTNYGPSLQECSSDFVSQIETRKACTIGAPYTIASRTVSSRRQPPCGGNGGALPTALYNVTFAPYGGETYNGFYKQLDASQCFPQTTNGVVAQAEIIMTENPFDSDLANYIYNASVGTNDGQLEFCARIAYSIGDELVNYLDSNLVLDVSLSAGINFTQVVNISSTQATNTVNQDVSSAIDVTSFLCGDPNENDGTPYAEDYSLGQSFRVCVDVMPADRDKFGLTNFKDVKCSTASGSETTIVSLVNEVATAASILTSLFDNDATVGAKSVGSTPTVASGRAISFSTVVTNAYLTGDADTLTCAGSVDVETIDPAGQIFCDDVTTGFGTGMGYGTPLFFTYNEEGYGMCCVDQPCRLEEGGEQLSCDADQDYISEDAALTKIDLYDAIASARYCWTPHMKNQRNRRHLVSFTVPNPMASSSASSRRRMDEETGAAVTGATADFGAIIKLSSSSSSLFTASGPFPLWATTTLVSALIAGLVSLI